MDIKSQKLKTFKISKRYSLKSWNDSFNQFQKYINLRQLFIYILQPFRLIIKLHVYVFPIKWLVYRNWAFIVLFSFISSWQLFCTIYIFACILFFSDKVVPQGFYLSFEGLSLSFAILKYESRFFFMHYYLFFNYFFSVFFFLKE